MAGNYFLLQCIIQSYLVKEVAENMVSCKIFTTTSQSIPTARKLSIFTTSKLQDKVFFICFAVFQRAIARHGCTSFDYNDTLEKQGLRGESA